MKSNTYTVIKTDQESQFQKANGKEANITTVSEKHCTFKGFYELFGKRERGLIPWFHLSLHVLILLSRADESNKTQIVIG